jgi:hypothetical protein
MYMCAGIPLCSPHASQVFCEQSLDGGGWMKILQYTSTYYLVNNSAIGTIATAAVDATAKLSDDNINSISVFGPRVFRYPTGNSSLHVYINTSLPFNDKAMGQGFLSSFSGCEAGSFAQCANAFRVSTLPAGYIYTSADPAFMGVMVLRNDCTSMFFDYTPLGVSCYRSDGATHCPVAGTCRCFNTGLACGSQYPPITPATLYVRPFGPV